MTTENENNTQEASSVQRLVRALRWVKVKPKKPGEYFTRCAEDGSCVNAVTVKKTGRGLSVYCAAYNDRVPMSQIGETELDWAERPNGEHSNAPTKTA